MTRSIAMTRYIASTILIAFLTLSCDEIEPSPAGEGAHPATAASTTQAATEPAELTAAKVVESYKLLRLLTPDPVYVDRQLAMLCRGANETDVVKAEAIHGPHAYSTIRIFMNAAAADAFSRSNSSYPVGAVIVKEKSPFDYHDNEGKAVTRKGGVGGMIKHAPGYDPKNGDWEYFYIEKGAKLQSGKMDSCRDCHANASTKDYVFGQWAASIKSKSGE